MCSRYSSRVVAPMHCSSPRASAGFSMLLASMAPAALPAPTTVCSSSMKRMISPSLRWISSMDAFSRSSNSPRKRVPASMAPKSSEMTRLPSSGSGASLVTIVCASPSTMAVLPTPASPISTGIVLGAPAEHLQDTQDLGVAADNRVELAFARGRRSGRGCTSPARGICFPSRVL